MENIKNEYLWGFALDVFYLMVDLLIYGICWFFVSMNNDKRFNK